MKSLNTHKGTVVRAIVEFNDGTKEFVEPLNDNVGGIVLDPTRFSSASSLTIPPTNEAFLILDNGSKSRSVSNKSGFKKIEAFVIYPDGTTWQGRIDNKYDDSFAFLWSDNLIQKNSDQSAIQSFYGTFQWEKIPTTLVLFGNVLSGGNCGTGHACGKQCE
ncbi:hypothetical protein [Vibrio kanaloae]|uniref:hypothetical protein n=1 Tax=Vibrio kanaloae TaxID=170673 RepID=UPI0011B7E335|nr:hypothetical protein [Vibrio kanaloae]KAB0462015.1 hypothetical protein F7Q89_15860 [Vibrio kanaloae]